MSGFKDVIGHRDIIEYIKKAVANDMVSHAYILNGERGSGKKMLANLFAETLECETGGEEPCLKCHACKQMESGNHPDVIHVTHEKPMTISVNDIRRQVTDTVQIKPYSGPYKIYIIPEAELMNTQAQNALLKTLEEPPEYTVIFLLTQNADRLLPTIQSRCVMLKLRNIKDTLVKKYLMEQMEVPEYQADLCTAFAQGNIGKASMLATSEHFNEIREEVVHLMRNINQMEVTELLEAVDRMAQLKLEITDYLDLIMVWYRDVLMYKATKEVDRVIFSDQVKGIKVRASKSSYEGIEQILEAIETAKARLRANVKADLALQLLLLTIKEN